MIPTPKGIIGEFQKKILCLFSTVPDAKHFYLAGGTALAEFYYGHRRSFDLDLFTGVEQFVEKASRDFERIVRNQYSLNRIRRYKTSVEYEITKAGDSIRVQLAQDSPFRFKDPIMTDLGVFVNDYEDVITDKFLAFFGRAAERDAVDLYFILKHESFQKMAKRAKQKDPGFDLYWMAVALHSTRKFPDNIADWDVEMAQPADAGAIKKVFESLSQRIIRNISKNKNTE